MAMQACEACGDQKGRTLALVMGVWELGGKTKICKGCKQAETLADAPTPVASLAFSLTVFFFIEM